MRNWIEKPPPTQSCELIIGHRISFLPRNADVKSEEPFFSVLEFIVAQVDMNKADRPSVLVYSVYRVQEK